MLSMQQSYSRLFRPWDISDNKTDISDSSKLNKEDLILKRKNFDEAKRENRLRKIRGQYKKADTIHQDATVSTTTLDSEAKESPVTSLTLCCDRLLQNDAEKKLENEDFKRETIPSPIIPTEASFSSNVLPPIPQNPASVYNVPQGYFPEFLPASDIAQALGVPPTDPLLLESLAQGYAMELEYARILQQENEAKLINARKQRPKKYKCPHCQVGFSNNGQLKGHIRIHTGERPFKCDEKNCGKTFTRNEELTRHKRIHSGVRPFPCPTCGKKFGRRDHLKKHTRTHFLQAERMMPVFVPLSAVSHMAGFPYLYGY